MPRSGAAARARLERAALELFAEKGFEQTTAAEIAAAAGVTERTFFRHFSDKREVVCGIEVRMSDALRRALAELPDQVDPVGVMLQAFRRVVVDMDDDRDLVARRGRLLLDNPALRERQEGKMAAMGQLVADALHSRGVPEDRAALLARVGMSTLGHAVQVWQRDPASTPDAHLVRAFADLQDLFAEHRP